MINFYPGPSQPYFTVPDHIRRAFRQHVPSLSPHDKAYRVLLQQASETLRELLSVPASHTLLFCHSSMQIRNRIARDLTAATARVVLSGFESTQLLKAFDNCPCSPDVFHLKTSGDISKADNVLDWNSSLLTFAANERYAGSSFMPHARKSMPPSCSTLIVGDISSCVPYVSVDYSFLNSSFFSLSEGFGIPVSTSVWVVDEKCLSRAADQNRHEYDSLENMYQGIQKNVFYDIINALDLYLIQEVAKDMLRRSLPAIRRETDYKAAVFYQMLERHPVLSPVVSDRQWQSKTTIAAEAGNRSSEITVELNKRGVYPGIAPGLDDSRLIFANYPTHSKEQYELLVDALVVTGA